MKPGDVEGGWTENEGHGWCIVVATSRHKDRLDRSDAVERLAAHVTIDLMGRDCDPAPLRDLLADRRTYRWRSITKKEVDEERHFCWSEFCRPGAWCSEGAGRAWVEVLSVGNSEVYDLLDTPEEVTADA